MILRASMRAHPWRWIAAAVVVLVLLALLAAVLIVRSLLQPQRFTALLQSQLANVGLVLSVDKPAAPALWPHPAVQLQGFRLSVAGATTPLLSATEARIVVPWRALLHRQVAIERLEIETPRIDLEQLQSLLSHMQHGEGAPQLPHIGAGMRIVNGTLVRGGEPLLFDVNAETGPLIPGTPFHLDASARNEADRGGSLSLRMLPRYQSGALHFDRITLQAGIDGGPRAHMTGTASWQGGSEVAAMLQGELVLPAQTSVAVASSPVPATSTAAAQAARQYTFLLQAQPTPGDAPITIRIKLDGAGNHMDARAPPSALLAWWREVLKTAPQSSFSLPPVSGVAQLDTVDYGPLQMSGVHIDSGPDVMPAGNASTAAPAASSTSGR